MEKGIIKFLVLSGEKEYLINTDSITPDLKVFIGDTVEYEVKDDHVLITKKVEK